MRILFDLRISQILYNSGVGRYITGLVNAILKQKNNNQIFIIFDKEMSNNLLNIDYDKVDEIYYFQDLNKYNFKEKFDVLFLDDFLFYAKIKNINYFFDELFPEKIRNNTKYIVSILHDLVPFIFAKDFLNDPLIRSKYILAFETHKIVDHFFTNSLSTKNDGIKYMNRPETDFTNIYAGINKIFLENNKEYIYQKRLNNIICVMPASDRKKNVIGSVAGFTIAYNNNQIPKDSKLIICGSYQQNFLKELESIKNLPKNNIILTGFVDDKELIEYITTAKTTIFSSFYEGLGLPILESYACGTPCIASNVASMKELVLKECSFDPHNYNDIASKIKNIMNNEDIALKSLNFGKDLIKMKMNWDIIANKVLLKLGNI